MVVILEEITVALPSSPPTPVPVHEAVRLAKEVVELSTEVVDEFDVRLEITVVQVSVKKT